MTAPHTPPAIPEALVEKAAEVIAAHRWKSMGVSSVTCECGEILYGDESLTQFPADEAFRTHLARAVLAAALAPSDPATDERADDAFERDVLASEATEETSDG